MYELLIVGAGPHALTVLARLLEEDPDDSVDGYRREVKPKSYIRRYWTHQASCAQRRARLQSWLKENIMVVDDRGSWMTRWDEQFAGLGIPHLRSPSNIHPDPSSSYALEEFALDKRRACELHDMETMSKSADFRGPFHLPGTHLFKDFCRAVIRRYCLDAPGAIHRARVEQLTPVMAEGGAYSHCVALLSDGGEVCARRVLIAIGSTNVPRMPPFADGWAKPIRERVVDRTALVAGCSSSASDTSIPAWEGRMLHAWDVARSFAYRPLTTSIAASASSQDATPDGPLLPGSHTAQGRSLSGHRVVVVGGGLTAAQLVLLAIQHGSTDVVMLVRGSLKVKQFDADLHFLGRMRQAHLRYYARLPSAAQRLAALRAAVNGGSVSPEAMRLLEQMQRRGLLRIEEGIQVEAVDWSSCTTTACCGAENINEKVVAEHQNQQRQQGEPVEGTGGQCGGCGSMESTGDECDENSLPAAPHRTGGCWHLYLSRPLTVAPEGSGRRCSAARGSRSGGGRRSTYHDEGVPLLHCDDVWLATGSEVDVRQDPLLRSLQQQLPVEVQGGLPALTPQLRWCDGVEVFVTGAYAALQLGPGAGNLAGARTAAVRLLELWRREDPALCPAAAAASTASTSIKVPRPQGKSAGVAAVTDQGPAALAPESAPSAVVVRPIGTLCDCQEVAPNGAVGVAAA